MVSLLLSLAPQLSSELDVGEVWTVRVTPNDGYIDGDCTETASLFRTHYPKSRLSRYHPSVLIMMKQ